jgi:hypothetical protein
VKALRFLIVAGIAAGSIVATTAPADAVPAAAPVCNVTTDYPHGSGTVRGATNVHGVLSCNTKVTSMTIRVKLWLRTGYQQYLLVGDSGDVSNSGKDQLKSNAAWNQCHDGDVMHGEAYGYSTQIPYKTVNSHYSGPDVNVVGC